MCVPAREEAATIAAVVAPLVALREAGVLDQVVVLDDDSRDGTGAIAADLGADVVRPAALLADFGPVLGKGDAMWRALSVLRGDLVCFVDADSEDFGAHFACGLLGPLVCAPGVQFVKGFYRRPFKSSGDDVSPTGGGRVTELTARPLLAAFYPELAAVRQPLAGEFAARRELLERMAFCTGYAVEMGLLLDVWSTVGAHAHRAGRPRLAPEPPPAPGGPHPDGGAVLARRRRAGCGARAACRTAAPSDAARASRRSPSCARCAPTR